MLCLLRLLCMLGLIYRRGAKLKDSGFRRAWRGPCVCAILCNTMGTRAHHVQCSMPCMLCVLCSDSRCMWLMADLNPSFRGLFTVDGPCCWLSHWNPIYWTEQQGITSSKVGATLTSRPRQRTRNNLIRRPCKNGHFSAVLA